MTTSPKKRPASRRDKEIHHAVRVLLRPQVSVALQYGVSQARICQIVKKVGQEIDEYLCGEDFASLAADAARMRRLDWECQQRREEQYRESTSLMEQMRRPLAERTTTYDGLDREGKEPVKTVVKLKEHAGAVQVLKVRMRLNEAMQAAGRTAGQASSGTQHAHASVGRGTRRGKPQDDAEMFPPPVKRPLPECLPESDRTEWNKLPREVQDLAAGRLKIYPDMSLHQVSVPEGAPWAVYPWRSEAESNSANVASLVIDGLQSIEWYWQMLEHAELSKPLAHPNVLRKDKEGKWTYIEPQELPLPPVMPPAREALPAESPERIYWPYKSKAEHYAMLRAEMVLRGDLSREQYDSLNRWAEWLTGDKYPDPLARIERNLSAGASSSSSSGDGATEGGRDGETDGENGDRVPVASTEYSVLSTRLEHAAEPVGDSHDPHPGHLPEGEGEERENEAPSTEYSVLSTRLAHAAEAVGDSHHPHPGPLPEGEGGRMAGRRMTERQKRRMERGIRV
jgi:hypothetical protein